MELYYGKKAKIIAAKLNVNCFSASSGWLSRFKERHGLVFKKLAGDSADVSVNIKNIPKQTYCATVC
jgi:hypothetical protein